MKLDWEPTRLHLEQPLRISRSVMAERDAVWVYLSDERHTGYGEVVTSAYYGLDLDRITGLLQRCRAWARRHTDPRELVADLPTITADLHTAPGVAMAIDAAAHDLLGRCTATPVHRLIAAPYRREVATARTIGITAASTAARTATELTQQGFEVVKIKLGSADFDDDLARVRAVREAAPRARLLLDPNGCWDAPQAARHLERLAPLGVEAVEQPIAPGSPECLGWLSQRCEPPVIADEDAATLADVQRLAGRVAGVNVKLAKCGGIVAAREVIDAARAVGMDIMLGCLVASSLGLAPAVHLSGFARWVDLDGHLLLAADPWTGIGGHYGRIEVPDRPGLGVTRVAETPPPAEDRCRTRHRG
ncbi:dipeptide epimerase [Salinactinospora qingdaonensis]|uniref:Dipeptide epimerase n=1 Tax=Salinactinospora qingdaonensis TaxID=702744 RepID=A0ABP7GEZ0_9ACTN